MINQQFTNNTCIICSTININKNINTELLNVNYKKNYFYCHKHCKTKLLYYLDLLLKNQDLDFNIVDLHFSDFHEYNKNTNDNINIINKQEYKMEKYKQFMINYNIHSFSENIKNINLINEDNNNLSNLLFTISLWF